MSTTKTAIPVPIHYLPVEIRDAFYDLQERRATLRAWEKAFNKLLHSYFLSPDKVETMTRSIEAELVES